MNEDERWELAHNYNRTVNEGLIEPLECKKDGLPLHLRANKEFEPVFYCYFCETTYNLTLRQLKNLKERLSSL